MSVINNVLKDLETRESRFTPIEIGSPTASPPVQRKLKPVALILLLLLALLAVAGWIYLQQPRPDAVALATAVSPVSAAKKPESEPVAAVAEEPTEVALVNAGVVTDRMIGNQIIGLQIRESEQDMRLEFVMRDKVVAYLKERSENSFGYHLRGIESQIVAPVISDNRWIVDLAITPSEQGVDIQFETAPEILVETRQNLVDGESVWAINLRKATPPPPAAPVSAAITAIEPAETVAIVEATAAAPAPDQAAEPSLASSIASTEEAQASTEQPPEAVVKLEIKSTNPNLKSENQLEYAVELINSRRYVDAENLLQELLTGVEDHAARQHLLALYQDQKQLGRFHRLAAESMARYPDDAIFKTEFGRSIFKDSEYREVIELFATQKQLGPDQHALVAASYQRLDEHADAIRYYQLALKQDVNNARNWIGLGISQEQSSNLRSALDSYQRAVQLGNLNQDLRAFVDKRSVTLKRVLN